MRETPSPAALKLAQQVWEDYGHWTGFKDKNEQHVQDMARLIDVALKPLVEACENTSHYDSDFQAALTPWRTDV